MPEQGGQGLILAERREILAAIPAARPERDQALDELRRGQAPLPLFHRDVGLDRLGHAELAEQLDHERDPGAAREQAGIKGVIDLERQSWGRVGHRVPPWDVCTYSVTTSKGDAIAPRPWVRRPDGDSPGKP
jgi:hypothetical protein